MNVKKGTKLKDKNTKDIYEVTDIDHQMYGIIYEVSNDLNKKFHTYDSIKLIYDLHEESKYETLECNCGGYKTYNSHEGIYHSHWCYFGNKI